MSFSIPTGRVRLRHLRAADVAAFAAYRADPAVARFQGFDPYTEAQAAAFVAQQVGAAVPPAPGQWVQLAIAHAESDELLGDCALHLVEHEPRMGEMGITLAPRWQGQGYGREAVCGLLRFCFAELGLHRLVARTDVRNRPCVALLEAAGLRREGHFRQTAGTRANGATSTSTRCCGPSGPMGRSVTGRRTFVLSSSSLINEKPSSASY